MKLIALLLFLFSMDASAQAICGQLDLSARKSDKIRLFLSKYSPFGLYEPVQCGVSGEDFAVCRSCYEKFPTEEMMSTIRPMLASADHRRWHSEWHHMRYSANYLRKDGKVFRRALLSPKCPSSSPQVDNEPIDVPEQMRDLDRQSLLSGGIKASEMDNFVRLHNAIDGEVAGEDFFYMHHKMLKMVNLTLAFNGQACMQAWDNLPDTIDDKDFPHRYFKDYARINEQVPSEEEKQSARELFENFKKVIRETKEPDFLRSVSLSELGNCLQDDVHVYMHYIYNYRNNACQDNDPNSFACDDLGPDTSSPVNPMFWKLHGLVDQFIGHWLKANGYNKIAEHCHWYERGCYEWKGTWIGNMPLN